MRHAWRVALATAVPLIACGEDAAAPRVADIADLAGTWGVVTWEYSRAGDASHKADWVDLLGLTGSLTIEPNGEFQVTPALPGGFGSDYGTLTLEGDALYWDGEDDEEWVSFTLLAGTLTLSWPETEFVDMDRDGQPEDAWLKVTFRSTAER